MQLKRINSQNDILEIVQEIGFLPFFENEIEGLSIEENIASQYWFDGETDRRRCLESISLMKYMSRSRKRQRKDYTII